MKLKTIFISINLFISLTAHSQTLLIDAVFYNENGEPYLIERKYEDKRDSSLLFVYHEGFNSGYIRKKEIKHQDTTIVIEEYGDIHYKKTRAEMFAESNSQKSGGNKDTTFVSYYKEDLTGKKEYLGDSIFTKDNEMCAYSYHDDNKNIKLIMMLCNGLKIPLDSMEAVERVKSFYVNNMLVKVEWMDGKDIIDTRTECALYVNKLVCNSYRIHTDIVPKLYRTNTFSWNKDTTEMEWNQADFQSAIGEQDYYNRYIMHDSVIKQYSRTHDSLYRTNIYLYNKDKFRGIITDALNDDVLIEMDLFYAERDRFKHVMFADGKENHIDYKFDEKNRVKELTEYRDNKFRNRAVFRYF